MKKIAGDDRETSLARWTVLVSFLVLPFHFVFSGPQNHKEKDASYVSGQNGAGRFPLVSAGVAAALCTSSQDFPGVLHAVRDLQDDVNRVSRVQPELVKDVIPTVNEIVLIGTLGKCPLIERLVREKKLNVDGVAGKWETFVIHSVANPFPGIKQALVIAGSDKRGTIYGVYDLSSRVGVSPWYWWADVPVRHQANLFVLPGAHTNGEPAVKYRGIFINDEAPCLSGWTAEKFGGFNHAFYVKVFELILRLKGNFLWPAMWGSAFYADDTLNPRLADEYGVVIGTSHHEPMMRAHDEWRRFGKGPWNYDSNEVVLKDFWTQGIKRMNSYESLVTVGMRGDGDLPMSQGANISLLERIVRDQRDILHTVTGKDVTKVPQVWALYKEVQDYYDKGMRVPDDITLLLCDDNWGNIRKLPKLSDKPRTGGYGIYYHFDYVGGPRNYKWLNTNQIARVWEQMHLAYSYGVDRIWIVNVGDIKPMEFPISFFLDYAWNPDDWPAERLPDYTRAWATQQFGPAHAKEIAEILTAYTKYNSRRKPELLSPSTYSLVNFREAENVVADYSELARKAQTIYNSLENDQKDAYYELVLHPVLACSNLNDLYVTVGKNRLYAAEGRASTNDLADRARQLFEKDSLLTRYYNTELAGGKWNHMMDQTHIGYTYWQQPDFNAMPVVKKIEIPGGEEMGIAVEGSASWWPMEKSDCVLPEFDPFNRQSYSIEIFNRGSTSFTFSARSENSSIHVHPDHGTIRTEESLEVSVDWKRAPKGKQRVPISISGPKTTQIVYAVIDNPSSLAEKDIDGFVESNGYVSIEAEHYSRAVNLPPVVWQRIPDLGRTLSAMTIMPATASPESLRSSSPRLEYTMVLFDTGSVRVHAYLSPTLNFHSDQGLRYAISFDDETPQIMNMHANDSNMAWEKWVSNNINDVVSRHRISKPGRHTLKFWMVDPGVVLQKLIVECADLRPSYLGPPESFHHALKNEK